MSSNSKSVNTLVRNIVNHAENWRAVLQFRDITDPEAIESLLKHIDHPHWLVRWCIADTLGNLPDKKIYSPLHHLLNDKDQHVRKNAIKALARQPAYTIAETFNAIKDATTDERKIYLEIIERMNKHAIPFLSESLDIEDWMLANKAAELLWKIGRPEVLAPLCQGLQIKNVQKTCIVSLGSLKNKNALPFLEELLKTARLKHIASWAIKQIG